MSITYELILANITVDDLCLHLVEYHDPRGGGGEGARVTYYFIANITADDKTVQGLCLHLVEYHDPRGGGRGRGGGNVLTYSDQPMITADDETVKNWAYTWTSTMIRGGRGKGWG